MIDIKQAKKVFQDYVAKYDDKNSGVNCFLIWL